MAAITAIMNFAVNPPGAVVGGGDVLAGAILTSAMEVPCARGWA